MAEEIKVGIDLEVKGVDKSINSVRDLKTAIKEATNEQIRASEKFGIGSKEYDQASKRVSALKDKVDDLRDSSKSLQGSGIERSAQGFQQLGEGLKNLDFDKVKVGLGALKSALAATGVMLIVQAVGYLVENFDSLSKGNGFLAKSLRFVGDIITDITEKFYFLTDALGLTNSELDKQGEAIVENANKAKEALAGQTAEYDRQIAIAKASGKSAIDLEKAKQQAIIDTNKALIEQTIAYVRNGGVLTEEQNKLLTEQLNAIKNAKTQQTVIDLTQQGVEKENYKKHLDEKEKLQKESLERQRQIAIDNEHSLNESLKALREVQKTELSNTEAADGEIKLQQINAVRTKDFEDHKAFEEQKEAIAVDSAQRTTNSLQSISDAFFAFKSKNLKKGSAEDIAAAKKQFNINKALGIANATIQGVQGVIAAYSSGAAIPIIGAVMGPVFAVLAGVAAAAQIAKISSSKFDEGGGGGGGGSLSSGVGSASIPSPPGISTSQNNIGSTKFDAQGNTINGTPQQPTPVINVKAQVVETEMTDKQNEINTIKQQSTF